MSVASSIWVQKFFDCFNKKNEKFKCCALSYSTISIASIINLTICKIMQNVCAFKNRVQTLNISHIFLLNKKWVMCTSTLNDEEEQWMSHVIQMMKEFVFRNREFVK
jgi:hypothetical protein